MRGAVTWVVLGPDVRLVGLWGNVRVCYLDLGEGYEVG